MKITRLRDKKKFDIGNLNVTHRYLLNWRDSGYECEEKFERFVFFSTPYTRNR